MGSEAINALTIVGGYPPSDLFGGAIILRNLLGALDVDRLTVVANGLVVDEVRRAGGGLLDAAHVSVRPVTIPVRGLRRATRLLNPLLMPVVAARIALRSAGAIVAFPWGGQLGSELFVAAWLASRLTRRQLVVYEMDEWAASLGRKSGLAARLLERLLHRRILRDATTVFAISAPLAAMLERLSGRKVDVLPAATDAVIPEEPRPTSSIVLYGGAVYGAQADSIQRAARAAERCGLELVLHTSTPHADLVAVGVTASVTVRPMVSIEAFREVMRDAALLLLPLSFEPDQADVVRTSIPTKTAEYLASGVPILVHAPSDAALVLAAVAGGWAHVVAEPALEILAEAMRVLQATPELRARLLTNARRALGETFSLHAAAQRFRSSLEEG